MDADDSLEEAKEFRRVVRIDLKSARLGILVNRKGLWYCIVRLELVDKMETVSD